MNEQDALLKLLGEMSRAIEMRKEQLAELQQDRVALLRQGRRRGITTRDLAFVAGLSFQRVHQVTRDVEVESDDSAT